MLLVVIARDSDVCDHMNEKRHDVLVLVSGGRMFNLQSSATHGQVPLTIQWQIGGPVLATKYRTQNLLNITTHKEINIRDTLLTDAHYLR